MTDLRQEDVAVDRDENNEEGLQHLIRLVEGTGCPVCRELNLIVDRSMTLIQCDNCGIAFEYRYDRGVIPFHTIIESGT